MAWVTPDGEPAVRRWRAVDLSTLRALVKPEVPPRGRPWVVAVDGRSAAGKTTLAEALAAEPGSAVLHTDDLAWNEPLFGWGHLLTDRVLRPLQRGDGVDFCPPQWTAHGRTGGIRVAGDLTMLVVEGVGAAQRSVTGLVDYVIWVQSDFVEAERRGIERDVVSGVNGDRAQAVAFWHEWMAAEVAFLAQDRPWRRADLVVAGGSPPTREAGDPEGAGPRWLTGHMSEPEQDIDIRNNPESEAGERDTTQRVARASDGGAPPHEALAPGEQPEPTDEGTRGGDPLGGLTMDSEDAEKAVTPDTGPDELGDFSGQGGHV